MIDLEDDEFVQGVEEVIEEAVSDELTEEDYAADIMNDAMYRIEEANLFKQLINNSVFSKNSARPEILESVNKKIKQFAIRELEELLGLKSSKKQDSTASFSAQEEVALKTLLQTFSDVDLKILKMLINQVLKKDPSLGIKGDLTERNPEIVPINSQEPQLNQVTVKNIEKPKRKIQRAKGNPEKNAKTYRPVPSGKIQPKKMPTAEQLMQVLVPPSPSISVQKKQMGASDISERDTAVAKMRVGDAIQRLTGGNTIASDDSEPADSV